MTLDVDRLWAGWRMAYVTRIDADDAGADPADAGHCPFCRLESLPDEESLVVERGPRVFTVCNLYPYNSGHLMVMPSRHVAEVEDLDPDEAEELMRYTQRAVAAVKTEYGCEGVNLGMNLGRAAGAGIPRHLHMHVLPRWSGDTNYVTAIGGLKILPEELADTWSRLRRRLAGTTTPAR